MGRSFVKAFTAACVAAGAFTLSTPASAALNVVANCDAARPDPNAIACAGYYEGNLNGGSRESDLNAAIDALVGFNYPNVQFTAIEGTKDFFDATGGVLTFDTALFGPQIFSLHFGAAGEFNGDVTVLYLFDFGAGGATSVDLNQRGFSNGVIVPGGAIPEPATWAMMLLGFAGAGVALRRRRSNALLQIA